MSYCLNPYCHKPASNATGTKFCQSCGSKLLLKDRYRAIKHIGHGRTFLAVDEEEPSKPSCVIKQFLLIEKRFIISSGDNNKADTAIARLEAISKHPQIPQLLAHFGQDNWQYLVLEFIEGQDLAQILQAEGAFSETQIRHLLNSLLPVLEFIHDRNVIHGDVKPENIIRRPDGQFVLVDFAAAKFATRIPLEKTRASVGNHEYIAPEQGKGKAFFASDLYSLGVICIHLLTMVSPFELFDVGEDAWVWRDYLINNRVSDELGGILDKLLQNATKRRYQSAAEVLKDLNCEHKKNFQYLQATSAIAPTSKSLLPAWSCTDTLADHAELVNSIAISPDGEILASGSSDKTIKIWHLPTRKLLRTLDGHTDWVNSVAISSDGQILASGSYDKTVKLWDVGTGKELASLTGHTDWVDAIAISPDGQIVASGSYDNTIKLWDVLTGRELTSLTGHKSWVCAVAISPNSSQPVLASGSFDNTIKLWDLVTGKEICTLTGHLDTVLSVAISPDGQILASGSADSTIKLWDLSTSKEICTLAGNSGWIWFVNFSPDGRTLATGSGNNTIKLWQVDTAKEICAIAGHSKEVFSVAYAPDGQTLASGSDDCTIKIWRVVPHTRVG